MYAAVVAGIAVFLISVALLIYIFRKPTVATFGRVAGSTAAILQGHADALQQHAQAISATTTGQE